MYNDPEVSAELHRLAEAEPLPPFDTSAVLTRGRRGRRRRTLLGVSGGVTAVAAIAVAATLIPNISSAKQDPGVAGTENSQFEAVPGMPRGEAALYQKLSSEQARQLCTLMHPKEKQPFKSTGGSYLAGEHPAFETRIGHRDLFACQIPGGDRPTAKLIAEAAADPLPTTGAGQLRNCSVQTWVDVTGWRIMASDRSAAIRTAQIVAVSPSGRTAIACGLDNRPAWDVAPSFPGNTLFARLQELGPSDPVFTPAEGTKWAELIANGSGMAGSCDEKRRKCFNDSYTMWGRAPANATTVKVTSLGKSYEKPVNDGWWAVTWQHTVVNDLKDAPKLSAYDKNGKLVQDYNQ